MELSDFVKANLIKEKCAQVPIPTYIIIEPFNEKQAENALKKGNNTIKGEAFLRQAGGAVVTCAGNEVSLIPVTAYATERIMALYGSTEKGRNPVGWRAKNYNFIPNEQRYFELMKNTICNSTGHFEFKDIKDRSYYLTTSVHWTNGQSGQGGHLMQKVSVKGGETTEIILH